MVLTDAAPTTRSTGAAGAEVTLNARRFDFISTRRRRHSLEPLADRTGPFSGPARCSSAATSLTSPGRKPRPVPRPVTGDANELSYRTPALRLRRAAGGNYRSRPDPPRVHLSRRARGASWRPPTFYFPACSPRADGLVYTAATPRRPTTAVTLTVPTPRSRSWDDRLLGDFSFENVERARPYTGRLRPASNRTFTPAEQKSRHPRVQSPFARIAARHYSGSPPRAGPSVGRVATLHGAFTPLPG